MPGIDLTPVERSTLLVLFTENRPLKESAELKRIFGITLTANHRTKLLSLKLIHTTTNPFTHRISSKGKKWAQRVISSPKPKGQLCMGALCSLLGRLRLQVEQLGYALEDAFGDTPLAATNGHQRYIKEAAWSEADEALAQALQDMPVFLKAIAELKNETPDHLADIVSRTSVMAQLVLQSVRLAGKKRQLEVISEAGAEILYDPDKYYADSATQPGERVKVRKTPVIRGSANASVVVARGEAERI